MKYNTKRIYKCYNLNGVAGLRLEPPQKKMQLWEPSDETFAFICKRMIEDAHVSATYESYQNGDMATRITYTCLHSVEKKGVLY